MQTRRHILHGLLATNACAVAGTVPIAAAAQPPDILKDRFQFVGPEDDPEFHSTTAAVGTTPARHDEVATGFRLLLDVDRTHGPLGAARYFERITRKNKDDEPYNWEWTTRANPVIVGFFSLTNTLPSDGDQTHWCAAFVNFCLYAAGKKGTYSALSGSFRSYGNNTDEPKPGDIVVFARTGAQGASGFGHVAFFLEDRGDNVLCLGGNQRGTTGSTGAVVEAEFSKTSSGLILYGYRKIP